MKTVIETALCSIAVAGLLGVAATPVAAAGVKERIVPVEDTSIAISDPALKKYCANIRNSATSNVNHRECKTRDQWMKKGIDPLAPKE